VSYGRLVGWTFALWGLGGGLAIEVLDFIKAVRRVGHGWPWREPHGPGGGPYLVSVIGRAGAGAAVAGATSASVNGTTPLIALALGAAAPLILEKLSHQIPLDAGLPGANVAAGPPQAEHPAATGGTLARPESPRQEAVIQQGKEESAR
jgi:hypothetical protein